MAVRRCLTVGLSAVLILGASAIGRSAASPGNADAALAAASPSVHFTAEGDFGSSTNAQAVFAGIGAVAPDLNLGLGDLSYGADGDEQSWCDLVRAGVGPELPFELISGNHESDGLNGNIDNFAACLPNQLTGLVGTYGKEWYVDVPAAAPLVRFVMISPNLNFGSGKWNYTAGSSHYNWTAAAIDGAHAANIPWVVVGMHEPCLSSSVTVCSSGSDLMNLLVTKHVDLVLAGHVHMYERTKQLEHSASCPTIVPGKYSAACVDDSDSTMTQGGTVFATVGTGGEVQQHPKTTDPELPYYAATTGLHSSSWGMLDLTVDGDQLSGKFDTTSGTQLSDQFTISRSGGGPPANSPPSAAFTSSCSALSCSFDGSGSSDSDGTIASYAWTFGDAQGGAGSAASHDYAGDGSYSVTLTVTDNQGATNSVTHQVTVSAGGGGGGPVSFVAAAHGPPGSVKSQQLTVPAAVHAGDTMLLSFTRANTITWTGPSGLTGWTQLDSFTNGSTTSTVWQRTASSPDAGSTVRFTSGTYSKGVLELAVYRGASAAAAVFAHAGDSSRSAHVTPTITAPDGATVVSLWSDKSAGTTGWSAPGSVTVRDTAIGTGGGRYGTLLADSGGPVSGGSYGALTATTNAASTNGDMWTIALSGSGGPPANSPPTARFTSSCTARSCTFDGTGSSDTDGTIASYAWTFGDTQNGTGSAASHTYAGDGSYSVTLTVTDDQGATNSLSHSVTVSSGGGGNPVSFVAAAHGPAGSVKTQQLTVPTAVNAGDTMLLFFTQANTITWTGPAGVTGWTQLDSFTNGSTTSTVWEKTATAGDAQSTVRFTSGTYSKGILELAAYRGASGTTPVLAHAAESGQANHTTPTITAPDGATVISLWSDKSSGTTSWSPPGSVTVRDTAIGTGGGRYSALLADSDTPVSSGSYGGLTATTNAASIHGDMWTIALPAIG